MPHSSRDDAANAHDAAHARDGSASSPGNQNDTQPAHSFVPEHALPDSPFEHGPDTRQLVLVKHGQRFVFRYAAGEETLVLQRLSEMVRDEDSDLDWFDAAVLSHQMGQCMSAQLEALLKA